MDFGMLPPEINSARMYTGPGSGPMLAAAAAWDGLAEQLHATATSYESVLSGLAAEWQGPSSTQMAAAAAPYRAWLGATAVQAEDAAMQAKAATAAYETAFAATVPPPMIAANRSQLIALVTTNFFGQNTPAIMATETAYTEMWAQDTAAMYGYAGASASASDITPFSQPPQTTNPAGTAGHAASLAHSSGTATSAPAQALPHVMSAGPQSLQSLAAPSASAAQAGSDPSLASALNQFAIGELSPLALIEFGINPQLLGVQNYLLPQGAVNITEATQQAFAPGGGGLLQLEFGSTAPAASASGSPLAGVSAGFGRAALAGGLSVPQGWVSTSPAIKTVAAAPLAQSGPATAGASAAPTAQPPANLLNNAAMSGLAGRAMADNDDTAARPGGTVNTAAIGKATTTSNIFVIPEPED
jgi:PPE-repeat protein